MKRYFLGFFFIILLVLGALLTSATNLQADNSSHSTGHSTSAPTKIPTKTFTPTKTRTPTKTPTSTRTPTSTPTPRHVNLPPLFLAEVKGEVTLLHAGSKKKVDPPQKLDAGDEIVTGKDATAYLELESGGVIEIAPNSDMKIKDLNINPDSFMARFQMAFGRFKATIHKLTLAHSVFEIEAGGVVTGIRGTVFEVDYDQQKKVETTKTFEGTVYTQVNGKENLVEKGFSLAVAANGVPVVGTLSSSDVSDFIDFVNASDKLEKAKEILLKKLEDRLLHDLTNGILGDDGHGHGTFHFHF